MLRRLLESRAIARIGGSRLARAVVRRGPGFVDWASGVDAVSSTVLARPSSIAAVHLDHRLGYEDPPMSVDVDVSESDIGAMFDHVAATWSKLGETEAFWSVISRDEFRSDAATDRQAFYALGESNRAELLATLQRNGIDPHDLKSCLEFGCGVGRTTWLLAGQFDRVVGVDVSSPHLEITRQWLAQQNIGNVALHRIDSAGDLATLPKVDLVYSMIVLQHNPPPIIAKILSKLLDALNGGGIAVVQIPTYVRGYVFDASSYLAFASENEAIEMHVLPQSDVFRIVEAAGCRVLEVFEDSWTGLTSKTTSNTFVIARPSPSAGPSAGLGRADRPVNAWPVDRPLGDGVNVVGYLGKQLSLGDSGRLIARSLAENGVDSVALSFAAAPSPNVDPPFPTVDRIRHRTTLAVVPADQFPVLHQWHPELFETTERMIGYCFWEMSQLSEAGIRGVDHLDEVWVATDFVKRAFERLGRVPVRHVPLSIAKPLPSARSRDSFPPFRAAGDRLVVGVTFDHFSVLERKNPIAAIRAFTQAVSVGDGPMLVIKTLNADAHPEAHGLLVEAAEGRDDVVVWDAHLSRPDQFAFLSHLDVLMSLHRGEGFGVHLAEAMWLGVPCVATRYSGNLDFMDDSCARLVDYSMIDVENGGTIYPSGTQWADPDIEDAADALRELLGDADLRRSLGSAATARMIARPDEAEMADTIRRLLAR